MFHCDNQNCRAIYSDTEAFDLKGNCKKCGMHLANEQGLAWNFLEAQRKAKEQPAPKPGTEVKNTPKQQPTPQPPQAKMPAQQPAQATPAAAKVQPTPEQNVQPNTSKGTT